MACPVLEVKTCTALTARQHHTDVPDLLSAPVRNVPLDELMLPGGLTLYSGVPIESKWRDGFTVR